MKIIEKSDPRFELLQTDWWVGEKLCCDVCKTVFEVEQQDTPTLNFKHGYNGERDRDVAGFNCPRCQRSCWVLFKYSEIVKRLTSRSEESHDLIWWKRFWRSV